jgi:hypothetical protein
MKTLFTDKFLGKMNAGVLQPDKIYMPLIDRGSSRSQKIRLRHGFELRSLFVPRVEKGFILKHDQVTQFAGYRPLAPEVRINAVVQNLHPLMH